MKVKGLPRYNQVIDIHDNRSRTLIPMQDGKIFFENTLKRLDQQLKERMVEKRTGKKGR